VIVYNDSAGEIAMIPQKIRILDEKELELVDSLTSIGIKRNIAAVIVYLSRNDEATSRQIELAANLSQPEISLAMQAMRENCWTEEREFKISWTGRPTKFYRLSTPLEEIVAYYEEKKQNESARATGLVQKLKELVAVV
jgi:predicted transcriptional regulator